MFIYRTATAGEHKGTAQRHGAADEFERLASEHQERTRLRLRHIERAIVRLVYRFGLGHCQLATLARCYVELADRLCGHRCRNEMELFPASFDCEDSADEDFAERLRMVQDAHHDMVVVLDRLRAATNDYQACLDAGPAYADLLHDFSSLDGMLRRQWDIQERFLQRLIECLVDSQMPPDAQEG